MSSEQLRVAGHTHVNQVDDEPSLIVGSTEFSKHDADVLVDALFEPAARHLQQYWQSLQQAYGSQQPRRT